MNTTPFAVGEEVFPDGEIGRTVNFEVIEVFDNMCIKIRLTSVDEFWKNFGLASGQEYMLYYHSNGAREFWAFRDRSLALLTVSISNGKKIYVLP